jgi:fatty acid desaturase
MVYQADVRTLCILFGIATIRVAAFLAPTLWQVFSLPAIIGSTMLVMAIKHNHIHVPVFCTKRANRIFDYVLNILTGTTTSSMKINHILNHHRHHDGPGDWGQTSSFASKRPFDALLDALVKTPKQFIQGKRLWKADNPHHPILKYARIEQFMILTTYAVLGFYIPIATLITVFIPLFICQFALVAFNFLQHYGCDPGNIYNVSRNFTGTTFNMLTFNVGYHTVHHLNPKLHWSHFKTTFAAIQPHIDPRLIEPNFGAAVIKFMRNNPKAQDPTSLNAVRSA